MAVRLEDVIAQVLALPAEDRAEVLAQLQASLAGRDAGAPSAQPGASAPGTPTRLLDLAGTGRGLWGDDSNLNLRRLRDEWR
jgi:hypothetical protein